MNWRSNMKQWEEMEYFDTLEEKVENIITQLISLRDERQSLKKKILEQERNLADLNAKLENFMQIKDKARQKIESILDRIEQLDV